MPCRNFQIMSLSEGCLSLSNPTECLLKEQWHLPLTCVVCFEICEFGSPVGWKDCAEAPWRLSGFGCCSRFSWNFWKLVLCCLISSFKLLYLLLPTHSRPSWDSTWSAQCSIRITISLDLRSHLSLFVSGTYPWSIPELAQGRLGLQIRGHRNARGFGAICSHSLSLGPDESRLGQRFSVSPTNMDLSLNCPFPLDNTGRPWLTSSSTGCSMLNLGPFNNQ